MENYRSNFPLVYYVFQQDRNIQSNIIYKPLVNIL